jgi:hypothetical protein
VKRYVGMNENPLQFANEYEKFCTNVFRENNVSGNDVMPDELKTYDMLSTLTLYLNMSASTEVNAVVDCSAPEKSDTAVLYLKKSTGMEASLTHPSKR